MSSKLSDDGTNYQVKKKMRRRGNKKDDEEIPINYDEDNKK